MCLHRRRPLLLPDCVRLCFKVNGCFDWSFSGECADKQKRGDEVTPWNRAQVKVRSSPTKCWAKGKTTGNRSWRDIPGISFTCQLLLRNQECRCAASGWQQDFCFLVFWCTEIKINYSMFFSFRNSFNEEADLLTLLHKGTFPTTWGHHGNHFSFCLSSVAFQVRNKVLFWNYFLMSRSSFFIPWCWHFHASSVLMDMGMFPIPMGTTTWPQSITCDCWVRLPVISVLFLWYSPSPTVIH